MLPPRLTGLWPAALGLTAAAAAADSANHVLVPLKRQINNPYTIAATVGTPGQDVSLRVSTSSATTWLLDAGACKRSWDADNIPIETPAGANCELGSCMCCLGTPNGVVTETPFADPVL